MDIILSGIILILGATCIYFYKKNNEYKKIESNTAQVSATLEMKNEMVDDLLNKQSILSSNLNNKEELLNTSMKEKSIFTDELKILKTQSKVKDEYILNLKKAMKNRGEFITGEVLSALKKSLVNKEIIKENEMIILDNIFIPYTQNQKVYARQIDHLIIMQSGIIVIETKYWKGKVLHGISKGQNKELTFVLDSMFPSLGVDTEQTIILQKDSGGDHKFVQYEDPIKQVRLSAAKINNLIKDKLNLNAFVYPVIFFSYPVDKDNYLINKSKIEDKMLGIFNSQEELCLAIEKNVVSGSKKLTIEQIEQIKNLISI